MYRLRTSLFVALLILTVVGCKGRGDIAENMSDSEKLELLDLQIERNPKNAEAYYDRSVVLLSLGRTKEALSDIKRAVELKPDKMEYRLQQADLYFANGNVEDSYKALAEAEKLAPESDEVQLKMGEVTFYSHDYDRSLQCLTKVTERDPNNQTALLMKGFIYKEKGDTASAVQLLRKVCDLYPDFEPAFEELGVLYSTRNDPMALEYLNTAVQLQPNNTNALYALAMFHQQNNHFDEAENLYHRILDINSQSADAWHNLGYIELIERGDYQRAIGYFDSALVADPTHGAARTNRELAMELAQQ